MATDFNTNAIASGGGFKPSSKDTPLDIRSRVETEADISSIPNPFVGLEIFVLDTQKKFRVLSLKEVTSGVTKKNVVDEYIEIPLGGNATSDFSGDYNDLTNKPNIPTKISDLANDSDFITEIPENYITEEELGEYVTKEYVDGKVWSMDNLGQDVKEAMTGGSIPIVAENSITEKHIVDGQVTANKTSFLYEEHINLNNANECVAGALGTSNGNVVQNSTYTTTGFMLAVPGMTYKTTRGLHCYCLYDENKSYISGVTLSNDNKEQFTISDDENVRYIRCCVWGADNLTEWNFCKKDNFVDTYLPFDSSENKKLIISDERLKSEIINNVKDSLDSSDVLYDDSVSVEMIDFLYRHHENLVNPNTCSQGYVGGNGQIANYAGVYVTDYIEVEEGETYIGGGNFASGYYDGDKTFVEVFQANGSWTVPTGKNIKYARVSGLSEGNMCIVKSSIMPTVKPAYTENDLRFKNDEMRRYFADYIGGGGSPLKGLKANFLGDSITQGTGTVEGAYHYWIAKEKGLSIARNYGIAGTKITTMDDDGGQSMCVRYVDMDDDADIVILFGGTNDRDGWLGTFDDRTEDTFYGACHILMKGLLEKYPGKRIGVVTPMKYSPTSDENPIVEALKEVASYYNIPVCDLYNELGMCFNLNSEIKSIYCPDGLHPSDEGHKIMARKIGAWIETL